jgi:carbon monoxide dehydrogenase subunit G
LVSNTPTDFGGEESFAATPERLFAVLTDLGTLAATIPDLVSSERPDERTLKCVVRPGFSFLRGTLKLSITLTDVRPSEAAAMRVAAQGIGVAMHIVSQLRIAADGSGSRLTWSATIEQMSGLVASISPSLVRAAADQTIRHAWRQVREKLGESPA